MSTDNASAFLERALSDWLRVGSSEESNRGTVFTIKDFAMAIDLARDETPPLIVQEYPGNSEDTYWFFRGMKTDFRDTAHFWVTCIIYECRRTTTDFSIIREIIDMIKNNYSPYLEKITPEVFQATVDEFSSYRTIGNIPHEYCWSGQMSTAMRISNEWNDVTVIGETEGEFVAFSWVTGA